MKRKEPSGIVILSFKTCIFYDTIRGGRRFIVCNAVKRENFVC